MSKENNSGRERCVFCLGTRAMHGKFFELKGTSKNARRAGWTPFYHQEAIWAQDFLNVNFANGTRFMCSYCIQSIKLLNRRVYRQFRTKPKGVKEDMGAFAIALKIVCRPGDFQDVARPIWQYSCCEMLANRLADTARQLEAQ